MSGTTNQNEKEQGFIFTQKIKEEGLITEFPTFDAQADELDAEDKTIEVAPPSAQLVISPEEAKKLSEEIEAKVKADAKGEEKNDDTDDLDKKTYVKITSTLYIKSAGSEKNKEGEYVELYKVLNPETNVVEKRQLTDKEKRALHVKSLKESHIKFHPIKNAVKTVGAYTVESSIGRKRLVKNKETQTNITTNQFGKAYRKARKNKNKLQKQSRKLARKK